MCGANGEIISTSASTASRRTAAVSGRAIAGGGWSSRPVGPDAAAVAERIQLVHELHERRDRRVQMHPRIDVVRHAANRGVRLAPQGALLLVERLPTDRTRRGSAGIR